MIRYKVVIDKEEVTLSIQSRDRTFYNGDELDENIYTKTYPKFFKKVGETTGYMNHLAAIEFISSPIQDFTSKEKSRKEEKEYDFTPRPEQYKMVDELGDLINEHIEDLIDFDVKIETEE